LFNIKILKLHFSLIFRKLNNTDKKFIIKYLNFIFEYNDRFFLKNNFALNCNKKLKKYT